MIYGIDLGTTNSLIGNRDGLITGMVPSVVKIENRDCGKHLIEDYKAVRSFKVNMSTGQEGKESVIASSVVLEKLVLLAKEQGHDVKEVVIAVPAFFTDNQRKATIQAAQSIGLKVHALINEPNAAAIRYNETHPRKLTVIFDLGGGTFDVSVIDGRIGEHDIQATDGIIKGGDDLDNAIRAHVIKATSMKIHRFEKEQHIQLKVLCEEAKKKIQKTKADVSIDLTAFKDAVDQKAYILTTNIYKDLMKVVFKQCIVETKRVINRSIPHDEYFDLLLVGGSTRCPYLQEWITQEIGQSPVRIDYDPDLIVAEGTCVFAKMVEEGTNELLISDVTKALSIGLHDGTGRVIIPNGAKIPIRESIKVTNPEETDTLRIELYQGDSILSEQNTSIGYIEYKYNKVMRTAESLMTVTVSVDASGIVKLTANELLEEPVELNIECK